METKTHPECCCKPGKGCRKCCHQEKAEQCDSCNGPLFPQDKEARIRALKAQIEAAQAELLTLEPP